MSTRSLLTLAALAAVTLTGCKSVYSNVYSNRKNSFKPPVTAAANDLKPTEIIRTEGLQGLPPGPGADQNAIPGIPGVEPAPAAPAADPAAPATPPAGGVPGL